MRSLRGVLAAVLLALLVGIGVWMGLAVSSGPGVAGTQARSGASEDEGAAVSSESSSPRDQARARAEAAEARAREQAVRAAILVAAAARESAQAQRRSEPEAPEAAPAPAGALTDRMGGRPELLAALNHDFMPLADECIEQARERVPALSGMLAVEVDFVADAELGAVIESVEFPERNEVEEAELLECIRETALSAVLPSPGENGREEILVTLRVEG